MKEKIKQLLNYKKREKNVYYELAPRDDLDPNLEYFKALDWALNNRKVNNVAISAPYGAGKSSVIESYIKKTGIKALQLSLPNFSGISTPEEIEEYIEKEFLKKVFYKVKHNKIPQSRYRKIYKKYAWSYFWRTLLVSVIGLCVFSIYDFSFVDKINKNIIDIIEKFDLFRLCEKRSISLLVIGHILTGVILLSAVWVVSLFVKWISSKWNNFEIDLLNKSKVKMDNEASESTLNKYLDEIVYFFEETKYKVVFIEDLDRFDDKAKRMFAKLREINILLNRYEPIKNHVTFVYAIKDDYFSDEADRTKFFDFIIPIIPYINNTNSKDLLLRRINEIRRSGINANISDDYVLKISSYISDMRILNNIINEYVIYKQTKKNEKIERLRDEEMFSLMVFKNLYPKFFSNIYTDDNELKRVFTCKRNFVNSKKISFKQDIDELENTISEQENEILADAREIKLALLQTIANNRVITRVEIANKEGLSYDDIMKDSFDLGRLDKTEIKVFFSNGYPYNNSTVFDDLDNKYKKNGKGYIARWRTAIQLQKGRIEGIHTRIANKKDEADRLKSACLKDLIALYGANEVLSGCKNVLENRLLIFLLRNGYVDECYADYINYFHPDSLSIAEYEFIHNIHEHGGMWEDDLELIHPERLLERIVEEEFGQIEILDKSIVRYMLINKIDSAKLKELINLLTSRKKETIDFICRYIVEEETSEILVRMLADSYPWLWHDIATSPISESEMMRCFDVVLASTDISTLRKMNNLDNFISDYMIETESLISGLHKTSINRIIDVLQELEIVLEKTSLREAPMELVDYLYKSNSYAVNRYMICEIIRIKSPNDYEKSKTQNYTVICSMGDCGLKDYVEDHVSEYIDEVVLNEYNVQESQEAIVRLLKLVDYEEEQAKKIIMSQKVVFSSLSGIIADINDKNEKAIIAVINFMIKNGKLEITWKTIQEYNDQFYFNDDVIIGISRVLDELLQSDSEPDTSVISELLTFKWEGNQYEKLIKRYKIQNLEFKQTDFEKIGEEQVGLLVKNACITYSNEYLKFIHNKYPTLMGPFFNAYKSEIISEIDIIDLNSIPFEYILSSVEYNEDERKRIMERCTPSSVSQEIAEYFAVQKCDISQEVIKTALNILPEDRKITLLSRYLEMFSNEELPNIIKTLPTDFHALADRTEHVVCFKYNESIHELLEGLRRKGYVLNLRTMTDGKDGKKVKISCKVRKHD